MEGFSDSTKRVRPSAKRLDLTELRKALEDGRVWAGLGLVWQPPGEPSHFDLEPDQSGNGTDVLVHVQKMPNQEPLLARLGCSGLWRIPPVGSEVALLIPDGDYDAGAIITSVLATGAAPAALDGDTLAGEAPKVSVKATGGDAILEASGVVHLTQTGATEQGVGLGKAIKDYLDAHTHAAGTLAAPSGGGPVTGATGAPSSAAPAGSVSVQVTP